MFIEQYVHLFNIIMLVSCTDDTTLNSLAREEFAIRKVPRNGTVTKLSDEDVRPVSFERKSKWLRQNPVTAARHL